MLKRTPIRTQLVIAFLLAGLIPIAIVGFTAWGAMDPDERIAIATQRWLVPAILSSCGAVVVLALLVAFRLTRSITSVVRLLTSLSNDIVDGKLTSRGDPQEANFDFREVVHHINGLIEAFVTPFRAVSEDLGRISKGIIPGRMETAYHGEFNDFEENFNRMIDMLNELQSGTSSLIASVRHGELMQRRLWGSFEGVWGELVNGMAELVATFAGLLHSMPVPVLMVDSECRIKFANLAAAQMARSRVGGILGSKSCELLPIETEAGAECPAKTAVEKRERVTGEGEVNVSDRHMHVMYSASPMRGMDGEVIGAFLIILDRTERWRAAEQKRELEEQIGRLQRLETVGTLASGFAHDFNNLLSCMYAHTHVIEAELPTGGMARSEFDRLLTAISDASNLVDRILAFSRTMNLEVDQVVMSRVVTETLELVRGVVPSNVTLSQQLADRSIAVAMDRGQVQQVLMNLVTNACHAMRPDGGRLEIGLSAYHSTEQRPLACGVLRAGSYCRLSVGDTGAGMDNATTQRAFDPFFTTRAPGQGTGIGLAVVHGIVLKLGGAIDVSSETGKGTTFDVYLPAATEEEDRATRK